ncbi:hypothetical protein NW752_000795 [Fusarium irregulare]|nr:hypothetical protein NW752_000795 [Fusarium irregulare]
MSRRGAGGGDDGVRRGGRGRGRGHGKPLSRRQAKKAVRSAQWRLRRAEAAAAGNSGETNTTGDGGDAMMSGGSGTNTTTGGSSSTNTSGGKTNTNPVGGSAGEGGDTNLVSGDNAGS